MDFYDRAGRAAAYSQDGEIIYDWNETPSAFIKDDKVYLYSGRIAGWLRNGWIFDLSGRAVMFSEDASGGPARPVRQARPVRGVRQVRPVRGVRQVAAARPAFQPA